MLRGGTVGFVALCTGMAASRTCVYTHNVVAARVGNLRKVLMLILYGAE
jgi:hypothetical protein